MRAVRATAAVAGATTAARAPTGAEREAWIVLALVDGIGEETFAALIAAFGSARQALAAAIDGRLDDWIDARRTAEGRPPIDGRVSANLRDAARQPDSRLAAMRELGLWTLTPLDSSYPRRLRDLDPPPFVIHGAGDPAALDRERAVAVVGTRRPTIAGRALANRICVRLVECGATVVSGLAFGIDGAAHAATVERGGVTVAVIGAGHRSPGPRAHDRLRSQIIETRGALISELHPDAHARKGTFPRRNRIIAALADAAIVVEAPIRSGARITAGHALDLGRPVLVAPGRVGDWSTAGSLALLRETPARPLVGLDEMVADLGYFGRRPVSTGAEAETGAGATRIASREPALAMLGSTERAIALRLCQGPAGLDVLVAETGLAPGAVSSAVTLLLMRGWIQSVGPAYVAAGPLAA